MTKLHFYKGLRTIGGTVVEIETDKARCLFDFGMIFQNVWEDLREDREDAALADYLKTGILPAVEGIYDEKDLKDYPLKPWKAENKPVFFLISHMHIDHMEALGFLAAGIPVYMTEESYLLYGGLKETGEIFYRFKEGCTGLRENIIYQKEDIFFRVIGTDHDVPGACGFEIQTDEGRVAYTGDLRLHGFHPEAALEFAQEVEGADVLITEGVTASFMEEEWKECQPESLSPDRKNSEEALIEEIKGVLREETGITVINLYERNVERAYVLLRELKKEGIKIVWEPCMAYYIHLFYPTETLYVYEALLGENREGKSPESLYTVPVTKEELQGQAESEKFLVQLSFKHTFYLLNLDYQNMLYIHSNGAPLGDYDPAYNKLINFLERFHIRYQYLGRGGHAYPGDLKYLLEEISPKYLVPLHSLKPEKVKCQEGIQILPREGSSYLLNNHILKELEKNENPGNQ